MWTAHGQYKISHLLQNNVFPFLFPPSTPHSPPPPPTISPRPSRSPTPSRSACIALCGCAFKSLSPIVCRRVFALKGRTERERWGRGGSQTSPENTSDSPQSSDHWEFHHKGTRQILSPPLQKTLDCLLLRFRERKQHSVTARQRRCGRFMTPPYLIHTFVTPLRPDPIHLNMFPFPMRAAMAAIPRAVSQLLPQEISKGSEQSPFPRRKVPRPLSSSFRRN